MVLGARKEDTRMQEDIEHRSVTLAIKGAKLTEQMLKSAIRKLLSTPQNGRSTTTNISRGKQSVKQLIGQNQGVSNIEITDDNIKSFERVAKKYGVDFAVQKVKGETPRYLVYFKSRDADALTAAFKEYTARKVKQKRPSVLAPLRDKKPMSKDKAADRVRKKAKEQAR